MIPAAGAQRAQQQPAARRPDPLPRFGDLRRLTLDQLYDASQELADWCCRGHRANADVAANLCKGCPRVGAVQVAYNAVCSEMEMRSEHRRAVARLVRQMKARR